MPGSVLAIDLGTSNTVAVLSAHGRSPRIVEIDGAQNMPSALFAADDGRLVVGREAERQARLDPARFEPNPKRRVDEGTLLLGDRVVPVTEAFAAVLGKVSGEVSRQLGSGRADEVRLTHPAQWGPVRRNVLLSAARQAGLGSNVVLIPEPVAAAAHFASFPSHSLSPGQALVVYDLGAGTFDVAAVGATQNGFVVLAEAGLADLGGLDVDQALLEHIGRQVASRDPQGWHRLTVPRSTADRRAQRMLREDIRAAKEALSGHPQTDVPLPEQFGDVLVTRAELENLIRPNLLRSVQLLADTVRRAGLSPDRLAGIYLVGGSSRIPLVANLVTGQLRVMPTNLDQPETAVALGALHVPRAGTNLATNQLPGRRPATGPPPQAGPATPPAPTFAPRPLTPPRRSSRHWLILSAASVVVAALIGGVIMWKTGHRGAPEGVKVANPKTYPADLACDSIITVDQVSTAIGAEMKFNQYGVDSSQQEESTSKCAWAAEDSEHDSSSASLSITEWYDFPASSDQEAFQFNGNDALRETIASSCFVTVAIKADKAIEVSAKNYHGSACKVAESLMKIAFDQLPDA